MEGERHKDECEASLNWGPLYEEKKQNLDADP
jgi:hypothetical protein